MFYVEPLYKDLITSVDSALEMIDIHEEKALSLMQLAEKNGVYNKSVGPMNMANNRMAAAQNIRNYLYSSKR